MIPAGLLADAVIRLPPPLTDRPDSTMRLRFPLARLASLLLFAALCAICAAWGLQLFSPRSPIAPAGAIAQSPGLSDLRQAGQLFGSPPAPSAGAAAAPSNVQVVGVIAAGPQGVALLSVDGQAAKPFRVGEKVAEGLIVTAVTPDSVALMRNGQPLTASAPARPSLDVLSSGPKQGTDMRNPGGALPPGVPIGAGVPGAPPPMPGTGLPPPGMPGQPMEQPGQSPPPPPPPPDAQQAGGGAGIPGQLPSGMSPLPPGQTGMPGVSQ